MTAAVTDHPTSEVTWSAPAPTPRRLPSRLRRRVVTGVAAAALFAAGGVGGFAIAQAADDDPATVDSTTPDDDAPDRGDLPGGRPHLDDGDVPPGLPLPDGTGESSTESDGGTT